MDKVPFSHCPTNKKNCVSTIDLTSYHKISPLPFNGNPQSIKEEIFDALAKCGQYEIQEENPAYIHAVFKSKWFKFKDDFQLYIDENNRLIHMKSASRLGYYDFKVNRQRVETFKHSFMQ